MTPLIQRCPLLFPQLNGKDIRRLRRHNDDPLALYMFAGNNDFHLKFPTPAARSNFYNKISSLCDESQLVSSESVGSIGNQAVRNFEWNYDENG